MNRKKKLLSYALNFALVLVLFLVVNVLMAAGIINRYYGGLIMQVCISVVLAVSLNLVTGLLGQLVLGHAGFMSLGAYAAALFTIHSGMATSGAGGVLTIIVATLVGGLVAAFFSFLIGVPALRLKGDYLAIITLGFGEIIRVVMLNLEITGGARGLAGIPVLTNVNTSMIVAALTIFIIWAYMLSRHGRAVLAVREDEIAAEASGINTFRTKIVAFVIAAFFAGVAGSLYAHQIGVLSPTKFDFNYSIEILVMVVLGGMGSITGSTIAAVILTLLPELLRSVADYRMLAYALILILMMLFRPGGLLGRSELSIAGFGRFLKRKLFGRKAAAAGVPMTAGEELEVEAQTVQEPAIDAILTAEVKEKDKPEAQPENAGEGKED